MQVFLGYVILKYLKGRRITIYFGCLVLLLIIELIQVTLTLTGVTSLDVFLPFMLFQGQITFTLYYSVCILGPLEMAKNSLLRQNVKLGGYLLCQIAGF